MKTYLIVLLMSTAMRVWAAEPEQCKTYEEECTVGRFKHQCTIYECMGRKLMVVRGMNQKPKIIIVRTPCTGEVVLYRNGQEL